MKSYLLELKVKKILVILYNCCLGIHENLDNGFKSLKSETTLMKVKINQTEEKVSSEESNQCFVQILYFYRLLLILFEYIELYINKAWNLDFNV